MSADPDANLTTRQLVIKNLVPFLSIAVIVYAVIYFTW